MSISLDELKPFSRIDTLNGLNLQHLELPDTPPDTMDPEPGVLRWPRDASRWATCYLIVSGDDLKTIRASLSAGRATFLMADGASGHEIRTEMTLLSVRPLFTAVSQAPPNAFGTPSSTSTTTTNTSSTTSTTTTTPCTTTTSSTTSTSTSTTTTGTGTSTTTTTSSTSTTTTSTPAPLPTDLYLLTLVDERFWWWYKPVTISESNLTSWDTLLTQIANALGVAIVQDTPVESAYLAPTKRWITSKAPACVMLDAVAYALNRRVVRRIDGSVRLEAWLPAAQWASLQYDNYANTLKERTGGGRLWMSDVQRSVPAGLDVTVGKTIAGVPQGDLYSLNEPLSTLNIAQYGGFTGVSGMTGRFTADAIATYVASGSPLPSNLPALNTLAAQAAQDWYGWRLADEDVQFAGTIPLFPTAWWDEVRWSFNATSRTVTTRCVAPPLWNPNTYGYFPVGSLSSTTATTPTKSGKDCSGTICEWELDVNRIWQNISNQCCNGCGCPAPGPDVCPDDYGCGRTTTYCYAGFASQSVGAQCTSTTTNTTGTTSTTVTSATTVTTTTSSGLGCSNGCTWANIPFVGYIKTSDPCPACCPCAEVTAAYDPCAGDITTPCSVQPVPCSPPEYTCSGTCYWLWSTTPGYKRWVIDPLRGGCSQNGTFYACTCDAPSVPGIECGDPATTKCYVPPYQCGGACEWVWWDDLGNPDATGWVGFCDKCNSVTDPDTGTEWLPETQCGCYQEPDFQGSGCGTQVVLTSCGAQPPGPPPPPPPPPPWTTATSSTTTTTNTTALCGGNCQWRGYLGGSWTILSVCPGASCYCAEPFYPSESDCDIVETPCFEGTTTSTTTSTSTTTTTTNTLTTTTTTSTTTTTTTTCYTTEGWYCLGLSGGGPACGPGKIRDCVFGCPPIGLACGGPYATEAECNESSACGTYCWQSGVFPSASYFCSPPLPGGVVSQVSGPYPDTVTCEAECAAEEIWYCVNASVCSGPGFDGCLQASDIPPGYAICSGPYTSEGDCNNVCDPTTTTTSSTTTTTTTTSGDCWSGSGYYCCKDAFDNYFCGNYPTAPACPPPDYSCVGGPYPDEGQCIAVCGV